MPSWRAQCLNFAVRTVVQRRNWGDPERLARRARRIFGVPDAVSGLWTRGLAIQSVDTRDERGDVVRGEWLIPSNAEKGTILYIHGGGYVACSPATHRPVTAGLARLTRRPVFSLEYRLAPEHPFPAATDDAFAAYRWLCGRRDAAPLVLAGDSAGGGLVLSTMVRARDAGLALPAGAVCFSPWTDLSGGGDSVQSNDGRCPMFVRQNIADFAAVYLQGTKPDDPRASPAFADLSGLPPTLVQVGADELLLDDARRVHERMLEAGSPSRLEIFDGVFHGWQVLTGFLPEADAALAQAAEFIASTRDDRARSVTVLQ